MSRLESVTIVHTTPGRLRALADSLEAKMSAGIPGHEVPTEWLWTSDGERIGFSIEQDEYHLERKGR